MLRVGLTGGLASGKTFVGDTLAEHGCRLLKADEVGHQLLLPGGAAHEPVVREFGASILGEDGTIDRAHLSEVVFPDRERLARLNAIIHPLVFEEEERFFRALAEEEPDGIAVVEAAILIETGNYRSFEKIVVAWCPVETQIARAIHRGMTREQALARLSHQMPLADKLSYAHYVVDTSGAKADTKERVAQLYRQLREATTSR